MIIKLKVRLLGAIIYVTIYLACLRELFLIGIPIINMSLHEVTVTLCQIFYVLIFLIPGGILFLACSFSLGLALVFWDSTMEIMKDENE